MDGKLTIEALLERNAFLILEMKSFRSDLIFIKDLVNKNCSKELKELIFPKIDKMLIKTKED